MGREVNAGTVYAVMKLKTEQFKQSLRESNTAVDTAVKKMESDYGRLREAANKAAKVLAGVGAAGIAGLTGFTKMAMDAVESENLFTESMGRNAEAARTWSKELRAQLGLNEYELRKQVGMWNTMLGSIGLAEEKAFGMSKSLVQLAYDMASFYNLRPEEAFEKLRSGVMGEIEPLRQLGVVVDETTLKSYALAHGIKKKVEELSQAEKAELRYRMILEQTTKAQGDMARTLDSPANKLRVLQEQTRMTATEFGMALIPVADKVLSLAKRGADYLSHLTEEQKKGLASWALYGSAAALAAAGLLKVATITPQVVLGVQTIRTLLMGNPWILGAAAALGALALAYYGVKKAQSAEEDALTGKIALLQQEMKHRKNVADQVGKMADRYDELAKKANRSHAEQTEFHQLGEQLKRRMDEVSSALGRQIGQWDGTTTAVRKAIAAYADLSEAQRKVAMLEAERSVVKARSDRDSAQSAVTTWGPRLAAIVRNLPAGTNMREWAGNKASEMQLSYQLAEAKLQDAIEAQEELRRTGKLKLTETTTPTTTTTTTNGDTKKPKAGKEKKAPTPLEIYQKGLEAREAWLSSAQRGLAAAVRDEDAGQAQAMRQAVERATAGLRGYLGEHAGARDAEVARAAKERLAELDQAQADAAERRAAAMRAYREAQAQATASLEDDLKLQRELVATAEARVKRAKELHGAGSEEESQAKTALEQARSALRGLEERHREGLENALKGAWTRIEDGYKRGAMSAEQAIAGIEAALAHAERERPGGASIEQREDALGRIAAIRAAEEKAAERLAKLEAEITEEIREQKRLRGEWTAADDLRELRAEVQRLSVAALMENDPEKAKGLERLAERARTELMRAQRRQAEEIGRGMAQSAAAQLEAMQRHGEAMTRHNEGLDAAREKQRQADIELAKAEGRWTKADQLAEERRALAALVEAQQAATGDAVKASELAAKVTERKAAVARLERDLAEEAAERMWRRWLDVWGRMGQAIWDARRDRGAIARYAREVTEQLTGKLWGNLWQKMTGGGGGQSFVDWLLTRLFPNGSETGGLVGQILGGLYDPEKHPKTAAWLQSLPGLAAGAVSIAQGRGGTLGNILTGAGMGAQIGGMLLPGVGTAIGAVGGALAGLLFGGDERDEAEREAQRVREAQLAELRRLNNALAPVTDWYRSMMLNLMPGVATLGGGANLAAAYARGSARGVRL